MELISLRKREWVSYALLFFIAVASSAAWTISFLVRSVGDEEVPTLLGMTLIEAKHLLETKKLSLEVTGGQFSEDIPTSNIISQSISSGERVRQGRTIGVEISKGAREQIAPRIVGLRRSAADAVLKASDLGSLDSGKSCSDHLPEENILAQSPEAGEVVRGGKVLLLTSSGTCSNRFVMPRVVGSSADRMVREFGRLKFQNRTEKKEVREGATPGTIVMSNMEQGSIVHPSDLFSWVIAAAPSPTPVPSILASPESNEEILVAPTAESTPN